MSDKQYFVLISAGGTGGHMSPASALASDLLARGYRVELMTDHRGAEFSSMFDGMKTHVVKSGTIGAGVMGKIKGVVNLSLGIIHALTLVKSIKPDLVIGFGGYPSVPGVFAAQKLDIPTILHEQNAIIGKANVFLAPNAERIALSVDNVAGLDREETFRSVITGNPVRAEISKLYDSEYPSFSDVDDMYILVMGGSLGATVFSEIVPKTLAQLPREYRKRLKIVQQCRAADIDQVRDVYKDAEIDATLDTFIDDVATELKKAHLVIARSGASTVAEVSVAGRPAIYVPYPHHKDQQQKKNADAVADVGGAWVMAEAGFTQDALLSRIETFFQNPDSLSRAAVHAKQCGKADAAKKLGNLVTAIMTDITV
ncbi:MAG: undecaprenyldiphospho-muramoylpentapeptide beta-N-acetylglucosaminyltransferase [Zetaproteobacteria bacterium]|nr:MAG: undecaprenyldiphospho-muramoylpentapeptide beta-N-acetylglucosaminyltransferase [Zetaproteobacteria bacterium]